MSVTGYFQATQQVENSWYRKLREHSLYDTPVIMTYYLEEGVKLTASVIIRDNFADHSGEYIILANGTLIPLHTVVDIFVHPEIIHEQDTRPTLRDEGESFKLMP